MAQLSTEQMLYLLYAASYSEEGTVTKGTVKSYLPKEQPINRIMQSLQKRKTLQEVGKLRVQPIPQIGFLVKKLKTLLILIKLIRTP